jgi:predicted membrane channel-forming protein YqfA (hemolysin III family)
VTTINIHFRTAPIALFVLSGAIFLLLIYVNGMGHLDSFWNMVFVLIGILFLIVGVTLYLYSSEMYEEDRKRYRQTSILR